MRARLDFGILALCYGVLQNDNSGAKVEVLEGCDTLEEDVARVEFSKTGIDESRNLGVDEEITWYLRTIGFHA